MKHETLNHGGDAGRALEPRSRRVRGDVAQVAPKLTKLVTTKIVTLRPRDTDPRTLERERLHEGLLRAQGRPAITDATEAVIAAGHALPDTQEGWLQVLEHKNEERVREALGALHRILAVEPARHRPILEQRLRRLEELGDEQATRDAATALRRRLH